jgi:hypothetical protein
MGMNYATATKVWASRRKNFDYKAWKNDTHITIGENSEMLFTYVPSTYARINNKWTKTRCQGIPLAIVTPNNILTLLIETSYRTPTINNRLSEVLGCNVYSDTGRHRTKESAVRISKRYYNGSNYAGMTDWNNDPANGNIPYKPGIQFQMDDKGCPVKVLNPPVDMSRYVKKDRIHEVSKQTADLRKLMVAMARLGSFDEAAKAKAERLYWSWAKTLGEVKPIDKIDVTNPMGEDAIALFVYGLNHTQSPDRGTWLNHAYVDSPIEDRIEEVKTKAVKRGLQLLRQHIYESSDGYEIVPVKQPTKE